MWIITILAVTAAAVIFYLLGRKHITVEREKENVYIRSLNKKLEDDCKASEIRLSEIKNQIIELQNSFQNKIQSLTIEFKNKEADFALREAELSHRLDNVKDNKFSRINEAATRFRQKLYNDIQVEIEEKQQEFNQWRGNLTLELLELQSKVDELRCNRDALIAANQREEEIRLQQDFYKIALSTESLDDIKLLKSIEKFLYNKDPLYKLIWNTFYMTPTKDMLNRVIGKDKTSGIYKITNQINGKIYIGQSVDLHTRLTNHIKAALGITTIAHQMVHDAMAADGLENFTFEIIEKCSKEQLNKKEKLWIETYSSDKYGYNRTAGSSKEENKND